MKRVTIEQCCRSGIIYSGSGYEISEFRIQFFIRIQPIFYKHIWKKKKNTLNSIKKKNMPTICHFYISYYSPTVHTRAVDPDPHSFSLLDPGG